MDYGDICSLSLEACSLKITWKIPEYLSLPNTSDYSLDSSPFVFANATWYLQLHPNNESGMSITLVRLHSLMKNHTIACMFDILKQNGEYLKDEHEQEYRPLRFNEFYGHCINKSYDIGEKFNRSELVTDRKIPTPNGTLVLMGHLLFEESTEEENLKICRSDNISTMCKNGEMKQNSSILSLTFSKIQSLRIVWKVPFFSSLPENVRDYSLNSPLFDFGYATWFLKLYPFLEDDTCMGFSIVRSRSLVPLFHEIIYTWDMVAKNGDLFIYNLHTDYKYNKFSFNAVSEMKESRKELFSPRSMLADCLAVDDDGNVTFFTQIFYEEASIKDAAIQKMLDELNMYRTFGGDLKNFLLNGSGHDLILKVKDKEFRVHRQILSSRSPVFESMLAHDMTEKNCGVVNIPDCDPAVIEQFLLYVYCGKMDSVDETNALGLYYSADKYGMVHLKDVCRSFIRSSLSPSNICYILQLAMTHSDEDLLEFAMEFFVKNKKEILSTAEWLSFLNENESIANDILNKSSGKASNQKQKTKKKQKPRRQKRRR